MFKIFVKFPSSAMFLGLDKASCDFSIPFFGTEIPQLKLSRFLHFSLSSIHYSVSNRDDTSTWEMSKLKELPGEKQMIPGKIMGSIRVAFCAQVCWNPTDVLNAEETRNF